MQRYFRATAYLLLLYDNCSPICCTTPPHYTTAPLSGRYQISSVLSAHLPAHGQSYIPTFSKSHKRIYQDHQDHAPYPSSPCYLEPSFHQPSTEDAALLSYLPPPSAVTMIEGKAHCKEGVVFTVHDHMNSNNLSLFPPDQPPGNDSISFVSKAECPLEDYTMLGDFSEASPEVWVGRGVEELVP